MRVRSSHGPLPLNERGVFDYVITFGILAISINLLSSISFQPMKYEDALTYTITEKLTKAQLIEIANSLQDHCLVDELSIIPMSKYYIDIRTRWQTHLNETRLLFKDIVNLGRNTRKVLVTAMNNMD